MGLYTIQRAITDEQILSCHEIMSELRPHVAKSEFLSTIERMQQQGYQLVFLSVSDVVCAVAGYRVNEMLRTGKMMEIDDLITSREFRSKRYGGLLLDWIIDEAWKIGCRFVELDSAVHRADAHRFYFRERMHILAYHFSIQLG